MPNGTTRHRNHIPTVVKCCGCVTDLKTAAAIIAVLGVVTSPSVSWAVVRHSFVIRMSCFVTTSAARADVVDISLNNILSFGFGANAGLGPSCLGPKNITKLSGLRSNEIKGATNSAFVTTVRSLGWTVLVADIVFIGFSLYFLYKIFRPPSEKAARRFMVSCIIAITLSFMYGMLYVGACMSVGGAFPVFEFFFCLIDVIIYASWIIFVQYICLYIRELNPPPPPSKFQEFIELLKLYSPVAIWKEYQRKNERLPLGTIIFSNFFFSWFSAWTYFLIVVNSYRRATA